MSLTLTRRSLFGVMLSNAACFAARHANAALRVVSGGALRVPLPAARRTTDPARAIDWADAWPLALQHDTLASLADGAVTYPLLAAPPVIDRADPRVATLTLRSAMTFSHGAPVTAASVVEAWRAARASPLGRLALSRLDTMNPFAAQGDLDLLVRLAVPGTLDETLAAWPLAVSAQGGRAGVGPFMPRGNDVATLVRNPRCPMGAAFLERVSLEAPRARNEELRAFTTQALDASWWGNSLYEVTRPAEAVRGRASVVIGIVPAPGGALTSPTAARTLERALAPLAAGDGAPLATFGFEPELSPGAAPDLAALVRTLGQREVRIAREASDGFLNTLAERIVALLDSAQIRVALVAPGEAADATLRAVAPLSGDPAVALASMLAAAAATAAGGDEASASAIVRTAAAARTRVAASAWGRGVVAVLGRASPVLHVRTGVRDVRFDVAGRVLLGDAWVRVVY
jgi:hypothetical protein